MSGGLSRSVMPPGADENSPVLHLGVDDVPVFRHRPEGSDRAFLAVMHGGVPAQAAEIVRPDVLLVQSGIADVDLIERDLFRKRGVIDFGWTVHPVPPLFSPISAPKP